MDKKLPSLVLLSIMGLQPGLAQTLDTKMATPDKVLLPAVSQGKAQETRKDGIKLNPSNKFNTAPHDIAAQLLAGRSFGVDSSAKNAPLKLRNKARINAAANNADSLLVYAIYYNTADATASTPNLEMCSFHSAPNIDFTREAPGKTLPDAVAYVRVKDKYYLFDEGVVSIVDAKTGETLKSGIPFRQGDEDLFPLQAGTYDPNDDMIYIGYWGEESKAMLAFNPNTYEIKELGDTPGHPMSMAASPDGKLYYIGQESDLYEFDKTKGEAKKLFDNVRAGKRYQPAGAGQAAAFDWATGYMYISNLTVDWHTHLSRIDVHTGKAVDIADFPDDQRVSGLYIPYTGADAPAAPTHIDFVGGKLQFMAPASTYTSNKPLSGQLTAYVSVDGAAAEEYTVEAAKAAELPIDLPEGKHVIEIELGNAAGRSTMRRLNAYVGTDVPAAVGSLQFETEDGKNARISWQAPTQSVNGGAVDDTTVNYRVVRYPDEVVVAEGLKDTSVSDVLPDTHARYYYEVTAYAADRVGATATSNVVPAGDTWVPPYTETFETQEDFDFFKVIDANNDSHTWAFLLPQVNNPNGYAFLTGNGTADPDTGIYDGHGNDDYLVSPKISLKAGADYRIHFETLENWYTDEYLTVLLGKQDKVTGDEVVIKKIEDLKSNTGYDFIISVPEDGFYHLMLHADNPGQSVNVSIDNVGVELYSQFNGPASVSDIEATAGEKGALSNTLSFEAPKTTYKNAPLDKISYINVYRNGGLKPVHVFESPKPGEHLTWTDNDVEQGSVTYRVVAYGEAGQGCEALVTNWVGLDVPVPVANLKVKMNADEQPVFTWDKVGDKGQHGGYVNPDDVKYVLCRYNEYNWEDHWQAVSDPVAGQNITDETYESWGGQEYVDYQIKAVNDAGYSEGAGVGIVLGTPYERPYNESFAGGAASQDPWTLSANSYNYAWEMVTGSGLAVKPYDGDDGMLRFSLKDNDSNNQVLMGPRISLDGAENAELSFFMYHGFEAEEGDLQLDVWTNYDDEGWEKSATVDYNNGQDGWARFALPMRKGAGNVQVAFGGYAADQSASIYVDKLKIDEAVENDMAVESIAIGKKRVEAGEGTTVSVGVANYGLRAADNYKVVLTRNGETYATKSGDALAQNASGRVTFDIPTAKTEAASSYTYRAFVENEGDTNVANDSSAVVKLYVHGSSLPTAGTLDASEQNGVRLSWLEPATSEVPDPVTDGFDDYESFIIDGIGDWTTYDGDGTSTVYFGGPEIAHAYEAKAWQVWAPVEAGFSLEKFSVLTPHSGDKYLACWAASDGVSETLPNDDWLISSEVKGGTDVSFYYRKPNDGSDPQIFEMLYSTTDKEPENFTAFDRDSIPSSTDWQLFEYTLPADAKYFALRSCSKGSYTVAFLDDITYTPLYGTKSELTLLGYNVYRDNELIAEKVPTTSYVDNTASVGTHTYYVTAVWQEGESNCSNTVELGVTTGIQATAAADGVKVATSGNTITVTGAEGCDVQVVTTAGQTVFSGKGKAVTSVSVADGTYIVKAGKTTVKVLVK